MSGARRKPTRDGSSPDRGQVACDHDPNSGRFVVKQADNGPSQMNSHGGAASGKEAATGELAGFEINGCSYPSGFHEPQRLELNSESARTEDLSRILTSRELQIAALVSMGQINKQIANRLAISEHTVSSYLNRIFSKLRVRSRSAVAAQYAFWVTKRAVEQGPRD